MSHLTPEEFVDAVDGTLGPLSDDRLRHLKGCVRCRDELASLGATLRDTRAADIPEPSPLFWDHLSRRVRERISKEAETEARAASAGDAWWWAWTWSRPLIPRSSPPVLCSRRDWPVGAGCGQTMEQRPLRAVTVGRSWSPAAVPAWWLRAIRPAPGDGTDGTDRRAGVGAVARDGRCGRVGRRRHRRVDARPRRD